MTKICIITDQHFGIRSDNVAFLDFYEKFYKNVFFPKIDKENITTILILGDTFDRRKYINYNSLSRAKAMFFDEIEARNIQVHMLVGNHDISFKNTNEINSPDLLLKEYSNFNIIENPITINIDETKICMVPWICPDMLDNTLEVMKNTQAEICMGHFEISGFAMYKGMECKDGLKTSIFDKFDMTFSGHYHHKSNKKHIYYLGNPYELTWQDYGDERGFHLFDLKTRKLEFIKNPYSIFVRIEYDDSKEIVDLNSLELKDCFVKLVIVNKIDYYQFDIFLQKLYGKGCIDIKIIEDLSEFSDGEIGEEINLEDTASILSHYIDSVATDLDKDEVKHFMQKLYIEAVNIEMV